MPHLTPPHLTPPTTPGPQVMERTVYAAIKRSDQEQIAAERRALVERVPLLAVLAPVRAGGAGSGGHALHPRMGSTWQTGGSIAHALQPGW